MTLGEILGTLRRGDQIPLSTTENQFGDEIIIEELSFDDGKYKITSLCSGSAEYGLGTCRCQSHPPWRVATVPRDEALYYIREVIAKKVEDRKQRDAEIAWLDHAIASLA